MCGTLQVLIAKRLVTALKLADKGYEVTVLDNLSPQIHGEDPQSTSPLYRSIRHRVRFLRGRVTHRNDWLRALDGQHAVIHLALSLIHICSESSCEWLSTTMIS